MANNQGVPQVVDNIPGVHNHSVLNYPDIVTINNTCFAKAYNTFLDLTDGAWNTLTLSTARRSATGPSAVNNIYDLTLDRFLSIPDITDTTTGSPVQFSRPTAMMYSWFKFKSFHLKLKNFMVIVERDSTGGIQVMDEPIFEIRKIFSQLNNGSLAVGSIPTLGGQRFTMSDLQKGIDVNIPFTQINWLNAQDLGHVNGVEVYNSLGEMTNSPQRVVVGSTITPAVISMFALDTPNFNIQLRLANFPALTNVILGINYIWEMSCTVECMTSDAIITLVLPRPGTGLISDKSFFKKLTEEEKNKTSTNVIVKKS